MLLPEPFLKRIRNSWSEGNINSFLASFDLPVPTSVRTHAIKSQAISTDRQVPWCPLGYYLPERPVFTLDPSFHAGAYYVQEASSMLLWNVLEQITEKKDQLCMLDLCAAPGGKSTLIANYLNGSGMLIANETVKARANTLKYNLIKEGYANVVVTQNDPADFKNLPGLFNIILADVPCSGEGMFRKDPQCTLEWSETHVEHCSSRQKRIIADVLPALKENGYLIYSTCTYSQQENMDNVSWFCQHLNLQSVELQFPKEWSITEMKIQQTFGYQCYPHQVEGEGFFIAVLRNQSKTTSSIQKVKKEAFTRLDKKLEALVRDWCALDHYASFSLQNRTVTMAEDFAGSLLNSVASHLWIVQAGVTAGNVNNNFFLPDHSLAMSQIPVHLPKVELSKHEALLYLKKELPSVPMQEKSWALASFNGNALGWFKNLGHRINNHLPMNNRILMDIS
jgi:16S rRNA C967 or C1407 C5-methylase (RsmB/RsmF family)